MLKIIFNYKKSLKTCCVSGIVIDDMFYLIKQASSSEGVKFTPTILDPSGFEREKYYRKSLKRDFSVLYLGNLFTTTRILYANNLYATSEVKEILTSEIDFTVHKTERLTFSYKDSAENVFSLVRNLATFQISEDVVAQRIGRVCELTNTKFLGTPEEHISKLLRINNSIPGFNSAMVKAIHGDYNALTKISSKWFKSLSSVNTNLPDKRQKRTKHKKKEREWCFYPSDPRKEMYE